MSAPIDPETGRPVRNWPSVEDLFADRRRLEAKRCTRDDKDSSGDWTFAAVARYGNQYEDGSPMILDDGDNCS